MSADARALLFASGAVLLEGETDSEHCLCGSPRAWQPKNSVIPRACI